MATTYITHASTDDHLEILEYAAKKGSPVNWTIHSKARRGDRVIFYFLNPRSSFIASGRVASESVLNEQEDRDWYGHYMADIEEIALLPAPQRLRDVKKMFPNWGWLKLPIPSTEVPAHVIDSFLQLLNMDITGQQMYPISDGQERKRRYWLTTHWPPTKEHAHNPPPHRHIWLKDKTQKKGKTIAIGDRVLIYEMKTGRNFKRENADGSHDHILAGNGRMGIVTVGEVVRQLLPDGRPNPDVYDDGSKKWWRWIAKTDNHNDSGFVPYDKIQAIIKKQNHLRGIGGGSGLIELTPEKYNELLIQFLANSKPVPTSTPPAHGYGGYGGGGESEAHKALKHYVANHPAKALNESGLTLVDEEYSFRTGDKIDVLLKDAEGRPVAVEVELSQSAIQVEGFLQAIKYRALVCAMWDRQIDGGRAILVAHHLAPEITHRCEEHGVEWHIVSADDMKP